MNTPSGAALALIRYRMRAVAIGELALRHARSWDRTPAISIHFDGKQVIEGKATAFTNGAIEAAIIHSRALLEFLGLKGNGKTQLRERTGTRQADDSVIEDFPPLQRLTIAKAIKAYPGPGDEAEAALAYVIYLANKGLAHTTNSFSRHDDGSRLLDIAFRGIPVLVVNSFYLPLGMRSPRYKPRSRKSAA
ncbi:MAG: hypothetical protein IPM15_07325 [Betaproteobacteria bacterium]|nr:hypothetical protein [Betaproteobacteria bacterium]